jgi:hypothetical protein
MKKLFFILWPLFAASVLHAGPFTVKAGLSRASLVSGYADKPLTGWQVSVSYEAPLSRALSLAPELAFVRRGSAEGLPTFGTNITNRITIDCLEAPLLLRWRVGKTIAAVRPLVLYGGGYAAYALKMESEIEAAGQTWAEDITAHSRRLDFGLLAGAGLEFPLLGRIFILEACWHKGLSRLNRIAYYQDWKTASLTLLLGIRL